MADIDDLLAKARAAHRDHRWPEAAMLWRELVWRAPEHAEHAVYAAHYGRALLESGETLRAVTLLQQAAGRHPDRADCASTLALAYSRIDAHDRAALAWADVLARFPAHRERRWWLPAAAHAWLEMGQLDQAEAACREAIAEFPDAAWGFAMRSVVAERRFDWVQALEMVDCALGVCSAVERSGLVVSKLRILGETGQVQACWTILAEELAQAPDSASLLSAAACLALSQGPVSEAAERWEAARALCPDSTEICIGMASLQRVTGQAAQAEELLRQCCARHPGDARLWQALAETCAYRRNMQAARDAWSAAARAAPLSILRLWSQCAFLGSCGAREEAEVLLAGAGAAGRVLWRGRFEYAKAARELDAALACLAELRRLSPAEGALAHAEAEIRSWRQAEGDLEAAAAILQAQRAASPGGVRTAELLARVLTLLGRAAEARQLAVSLPEADGRLGLAELRVWLDVQRGDWRGAGERWADLASRFFLPALHLPQAGLRLIGGRLKRGAEKGAIVISTVRNELPRLPGFLRHHRRLGVSGFVLVDNGSQDGTRDYLSGQPDVLLYATDDSFAHSHFGIRWLNQLIDLHGKGWVLYADADERLVFPGSEHRALGELTDYLAGRGEQIVPGVMIDMFPRYPGGASGAKLEWFDPITIRPSLTCPFIEAAGGARRRLFGTTVTLSKAPIIDAAAGVRYLSSHTTTPGPVASVSAALLHHHLDYLFDAENVARLSDEVARGEHSDFAVDRRRSLAMAQALAGGDLTGPGSLRYSGTAQLLQLGLLSTSAAFEARFG